MLAIFSSKWTGQEITIALFILITLLSLSISVFMEKFMTNGLEKRNNKEKQ